MQDLLSQEEIDALLDQYPDVVIALKGEQQENDEFFQELVLFFQNDLVIVLDDIEVI